MNGLIIWVVAITAIAAGVGIVIARRFGGAYFPAAMILLSLSALCGLGVLLLLWSHPTYFKDDHAIPWIETLGLGFLVSAVAFLFASCILGVTAVVATIVRARPPNDA